jgi:hypothetical protein
METQIKTAKELLAQIERRYFKGAGLAKASTLEGDERRGFVLAQVERLLTEEHGFSPMAMWLSDMFWTADEGRVPMPWDETPAIPEPGYRTNPLLSLKEQQTLTDREMGRLRLILEVAGLCHDLTLHFTFDLKEAFGIKNNWWVSNKQLVEWLSTTEYERIAMHIAYILRKFAIDVYVYGHYQPAQDALAELFSAEYSELVRDPKRTKIPPRDYVKTIIDAILQIERHWQRGRKLKLRPDLIMLHDEIYGVVPRQFDKGVLQAAQALYDYMDKEVYGRLTENDDFAPEVMKRFAEKVREVRSAYFAKGWLTDDSLEFAYLMAHAQNCGYGIWREEDEAL